MILDQLQKLDVAISEEIVDLRWPQLTSIMLLLSAWWVKNVLFALAAAVHDVRRRSAPWSAMLVGVATLLAAQAANLLKTVFDRPRPFAQDLWSGLGSLPSSGAMPSGHAATAVAGAVALGMLVPRARPAAYALALLVCTSRVYLGVHFAGDVLAGALLGASTAAGVVIAGRRLLGRRLSANDTIASDRRRVGPNPMTKKL